MKEIGKRVLVTGGNGMLGSSLVRALLTDGYSVRVLIFPGTQTKTLEGLDIEIVSGDLTTDLFFPELLSDCAYVAHVAASTTISPARSDEIWKINVVATRKLAMAAKEAGIEKFLHIGTANSFAQGTKANPGTEDGPFLAHIYGLDYIDSKFAIQQELLAMYKTDGFPVIIINPTFMIGPFDTGPTSGKMILHMLKGRLLFYGTGGRNFVHSADVARAAVNALARGRPGECYLAAGHNLSYREFASIVNDTAGKRRIMVRSPHLMTMGAAALSSFGAFIAGRAPKLSYTMAKMSSEESFYTADKAIRELDMPQTLISVAVRDSVKWFRENGYV